MVKGTSGRDSIPQWADELATLAWQDMNTVVGLLARVNDVFGTQCPWTACSRVALDGYLCPLGDFTQAGVITVADHLRSYSQLMRTATPALTSLTVLRAAMETSASLSWVWSQDDWKERHRRALLSTRRDQVTFTAGYSANRKHRYPMQRLGLTASEVAELLELSMKGAPPKRTKRMEELDAQDLYAVLSGAAHGSREVVGLVVQDTRGGGQQVVPHRRLSELVWKDVKKVIRPALDLLSERLQNQ